MSQFSDRDAVMEYLAGVWVKSARLIESPDAPHKTRDYASDGDRNLDAAYNSGKAETYRQCAADVMRLLAVNSDTTQLIRQLVEAQQ